MWSAPNYCYRMGNKAAVLKLDEHLNRDFLIYDSCEESVQVMNKDVLPYFL